MDGKTGFRIVAGLVLIAAIAGLTYVAFNAGVAQGVAAELPEAGSRQSPYPHFGHGMRYWHASPFFGFGCFGPLLAFFLLFLALRAFGFLFWGARWGGWHHGPWRMDRGEGGVPPMFHEWHRRAHAEPESSKSEKKE
jgi:hypothetical protein